ncbi:MAG TPA: ATP-binding protein [Turneriella sp.]|nr:ATP-binding protein [Turneriella sp.]
MPRLKKNFTAERAAIPIVHDFVKSALKDHGVSVETATDFILACDETATNIVEHSFVDKINVKEAKPQFILTLCCRKNKVTATFFDSGASFNLKDVEAPDISKNLRGEKRGGYGVFLIRKLVDKIVYSARRRLNVTRLIKET